MAEKKPDKKSDKKKGGEGGGLAKSSDVLGWLFGALAIIFIVGALLEGVGSRVVDMADDLPNGTTGSLSADTPIGTLVKTRWGTEVWALPEKIQLLGIQDEDAVGRLAEGPRFLEGDAWWYVQFEESPSGWVESINLMILKRTFLAFLGSFRTLFLWISAIVSILAGAGTLYSWWSLRKTMQKHRLQMKMLERKLVEDPLTQKNKKWERVEILISSENPGDWRVAILEADVMLDELITSMGYHGEALGDKMRAIEKSDFQTLDAAWEAHKVRNRIAHGGGDFVLTSREARRVVELYRAVFKEFQYI
ncbi:MAG: hypothetical protein AAB460_03245 [Patescibacteria group bacterium]